MAEYENGQLDSWGKLCEEKPLGDNVEVLLHHLIQRRSPVEYSVFAGAVKKCIAQKNLVLGSWVHALALECGIHSNAHLANQIICMYSSHGRLEEATEVFSNVPTPSRHMWASIILAHARHGQPRVAIGLYRQMRASTLYPHNRIFAAALQACASARDLAAGRKIHADFLISADKHNVVVGTCLVDMYSKCGSLEEARRVFDSLSTKDIVTWNAMLSGYAQRGLGEEALSLYGIMLEQGVSPVSRVTYVCLLQACASIRGLYQGKQIHEQIQASGMGADIVLGNCLVTMYAKCGSLEDASRVFGNLPSKNVVTWTAMIAGYAEQGLGWKALTLYGNMQQEGTTIPNQVTFVCLLQACASARALDQGKQLHAQIQERGLEADVVVGTCLVDMYAKCSNLVDARRVFDRLLIKDVVTWTAMIGGYAQNGFSQEAMCLYKEMLLKGITSVPAATYICVLQACGRVAALEKGKEVHADISKIGLEITSLSVANALIDMYCRCGSMVDACEVFNALGRTDVVTWSTLIAGYARLGDVNAVFDLLQKMREKGIEPDGITFLGILTACSHSGLVARGQRYFKMMIRTYGISPTIEHYTCMVDLLGRAGQVDKAMKMVKMMPFQPDAVVWSSVLGACRKWCNVAVGRAAFESAVRLDKVDAAAYVSMSNIYAAAKMEDDAKGVMALRAEAQALKKPGQSCWADSDGVVHRFVAGDREHPEWQDVDAKVKILLIKLKKNGYVPHLDSVLRDIPEDEKEAALCGHSEKLAIAYALHKTPQGTTIRVVKNLRVCEDCHRAIALISKLEQRTIVCRDARRFHVYKNGQCSCNDYW